MRKRFALFSAALVAALAATSSAARPAAPDLFHALPPGDVVATVDVAALFDKTLPALLAGRPESKAKLDANLAKLQTDFGLDLRHVRQIAVSCSLLDGARAEWVAAMDGDFAKLAAQGALARALDDFAKRTPRYSVRADSYGGATIYVLPEKRGDGAVAEQSAVAVLDAHTALYGSPNAVRRAVDARAGKGPNAASNALLVEAYGQSDASSPLRFGMVLDAVIKTQRQSDPNDPFLKTLSGVRYLFGSLGLAGNGGVALRVVSRANGAEDAKAILSMLSGLLDLGRAQMSGKPEVASLLGLVTVTSAGADVILSADVPPDRLDTLFQLVDRNRTVIARQ